MEMTQNLKLVGISWSNDPDAMIEDTKTTRTFFVKRGQMISEVKVKDIARDKVVLTYDGEDIDLR
jgi:type II secretory pathway component PulC